MLKLQAVRCKGTVHDVVNNLMKEIDIQLRQELAQRNRLHDKRNSEYIQRKRLYIS